MHGEPIELKGGAATGYAAEAGPVNIVFATAGHGLVGCGAFDVDALDRFSLAAARVSGIASVAELLAGKVNRVNAAAAARGVAVGMTGREALDRMT